MLQHIQANGISIAYRFDGPDRSIVISGDTTKSDRLIELAQTGKCVATFTNYLASRVQADSPQPAIWSPGPIEVQRGHQVFPLLYPGSLSMTLAARNVQQGAGVPERTCDQFVSDI
jgi:hypothetical protein